MSERLTPEEAAAIVGRSKSTILRWYDEKRIQGQRRLGRLTFSREEIERLRDSPNLPEPGEVKKR